MSVQGFSQIAIPNILHICVIICNVIQKALVLLLPVMADLTTIGTQMLAADGAIQVPEAHVYMGGRRRQ